MKFHALLEPKGPTTQTKDCQLNPIVCYLNNLHITSYDNEFNFNVICPFVTMLTNFIFLLGSPPPKIASYHISPACYIWCPSDRSPLIKLGL
jgi:hypothetical protein